VTFTELKEAVANHFVTTELVPFIPTAIEMAEAELNRRLRVRDMQARAYATLDGQFLALPTDFNAVRSVYITGDDGYRLSYITPEQLRYDKRRLPDTDEPCSFTILGDEIEVVPVPGTAVELEILYYRRLEALGDSNPENWLSKTNPDLYLYGTLLQVSPYLHKDARIATWRQFYESALAEINVQSERAEFSGGPLKVQTKPL